MNFRAFTSTVYRSRAIQALSGSVALTLLIVQLTLFYPSIYEQYESQIIEQSRVELALVRAAFFNADPEQISVPDTLLSDSLVGLVLVDASGRLLLNKGNTFDYVHDSGASVTESGTVHSENWTIPAKTSSLSGIGFIEREQIVNAALFKALGLSAFALLTSLTGALVAMFGAHRWYVGPIEQLIGALRDSRENSEGQLPESIEVTDGNDLRPLAEEFNGLIEAQRKAARQVKVKQQYLEFAAHHDPLTHLPNRLMFEDTLKRTVTETIASGLKFAVFLVDLDNFKFFNDQYGHLVGDKMVAEVGNRLRTMMRDIDLVARLDGDEFVVIQRDVEDTDSAEEVARRIMNVATAPYEYRGFTLKTAVSVGISSFPDDVHVQQDEHMLGEEIVNNAAVALQEAKSNGKNQYQLFNEKMRLRLTARIRLEQDLKIALQDEQFEVYYQPKINIHTRQCTGAEALVRWRHPVNGFVSPDAFVPVCEETGLIIELGAWILRTACIKTRELQEQGYPGLNVAVNISAVQFTDGGLLPMVVRALEESGLASELLELEITESAVMHDPEEVILSLHELSEHGMKLAIDDFGTGYSSLAYLKRFPVNTLKIDRAFITDISSDNDDVAIVEAVLGLGKHFNMKVVAEGVEDEEQLNFLKAQGCDIAQGYFISKPLSSEQYNHWLERWPYGVQSGSVIRMPELPAPDRTGTDD
ncbi:putative bifunctional diguanylate cyclase/phosphodiesterase [Granulosicoccus antarcticus]|uniref:putative bifunctional diguanylate cyclase/phosphodiesterase n=1 Tax=Granulosicoccus antarcticus TaxID=437505 RepID=UPI00146FC25A|nr:bifunctional diguanylate cyclase/phosphodiesterase [Granulosicoccus antarcticus]